MNRLQLPTVTLLCVDCVEPKRAILALENSKALCDFGAVKFLTSLETDYPHETIRPLHSLNDYSAFLLKHAHEHIDTPHVLIVQHDGWVLNPAAWDPAWLHCDYLGPLFMQETHVNAESVGVGGFCFRSRALMSTACGLLPTWDGHHSYDANDGRNNWGHEDGVLSKHLRRSLMARGYQFGSPLQAGHFACGGNPNQNYYFPDSFGFHRFFPDVVARMQAAGIQYRP